jgi:anti-sigma28 factor (negative regulator of flagellin synthesis)
MSDIAPLGRPDALPPAYNGRSAGDPGETAATGGSSRGSDRVELSAAARQASTHPPMRMELVAAVKDQIQQGTYLTADKVDLAATRLASALGA